MNNKTLKKILVVVAVIVVAGLCWLGCCRNRIGYVDAQAIVARSEAFRNLQVEQQIKSSELEKWMNASNKELKKATSEAKRKEMLAKLQAELTQKQLAMRAEFSAKATQAEEELMNLIKKVADKKCLKVVLSKATVVTGGVDITDDVIALMGNSEDGKATEEKSQESVDTEEVTDEVTAEDSQDEASKD